MELPRQGVEYARITFDDLPEGSVVEASIDRTTWVPVEATPEGGRVLLLGPAAPLDPVRQGIRMAQSDNLWVRALAGDEEILRIAGTVRII